MRWGILASTLVVASGAALWLASNLQTKAGEQGSANSSFAKIEAQKNSELYLKDARAFIFSRTESGQNLKLHDSVLVGPKSDAILVLSDDFGGGRIQLSANTIITLSRVGRRNEIPRIDIKQGEIKILEAPRPKRKPQPVEKSQVANTKPAEPELPGILISAGQQAVVLDEKLSNLQLVVSEKTRDLEIRPSEEPSQLPTSAEPIPVPNLPKMIAAESLESLSMAELSSDGEKINKDSENDTTALVEPMPASQVASLIQQNQPEPESKRTLVRASEQAKSRRAPAKENLTENSAALAAPAAEDPSTEALRADNTKTKGTYFEASTLLKARSYKDDASSENTLDLDLSLKAEIPMTNTFSAAVSGEIATIQIRKPNGGAPRPASLSAELKYSVIKNEKVQAQVAAGYLYQTTLGTGITAAYANVSSPIFGLDIITSFNKSELRASPRFSWINSGSYFFAFPLSYFWSEKYGFTLSYSSLSLKASGAAQSRFGAFGAGLNLKF